MKNVYVILIGILLLSPVYLSEASKNLEFRYFFRDNPEDILTRMSIEEKIGQVLIFGFKGYGLDRDYEDWLMDGKLGNVKIFLRNVQSKQQVQELTDYIATLTLSSSPCIPPFIATDMEGGTVNHLRYRGLYLAPAAGLVGATGDIENCRKTARLIALTLFEHGINVNFAPCADVLTNPGNRVIGTRSYGSDPELVYNMARVFIAEHRKVGILTTVKHFPGHGMSRLDSHHYSTHVDTGREELYHIHLYPYRRLIQENELDGLMVSHIVYNRGDPFYPASLSSEIINGYLRSHLNFDGIVVTDDLEMQGTQQCTNDILKAFILAFRAGNDLFLVSHTKTLQERLLREVPALFERGILSEEDLDQKVLRIVEAKRRYLLRFYATHGGKVVQQKLLKQAVCESQKVTDEGIVLLSSHIDGSIPAYFRKLLGENQKGLILAPTKGFAFRAKRYLDGWDVIDIEYTPDKKENAQKVEEVRNKLKYYDMVILGFANERHIPWVRACIGEKVPFVILSYDNPHYAARFARQALFIATSFGPYNPATDALFRTVFETGEFSKSFPYYF